MKQEMEKDYLGANGYLTGLGFRKRGPRPVTISKSLQLEELDEDEFYYDEFGVRHKKSDITELSDINVEELSFVDRPATKKQFMIIKNEEGDDIKVNGEKFELKDWESVSDIELEKIRETIKILSGLDLTNDLKRSVDTLTKYFGEKEVKKYNDRCEWTTVQNQLYGFCEDDLSMVSDEDIKISKSNDEKWPSLSGQFDRNKRILERQFEEYAVEERLV